MKAFYQNCNRDSKEDVCLVARACDIGGDNYRLITATWTERAKGEPTPKGTSSAQGLTRRNSAIQSIL